ncbi:tetratricopeptide repeat protein [Nocardia vinacea]|uniref:Tetratricopeptide repeat protein n=1 Tax=Nocardia vinacea TaxID=96468 RepID=A0ABZ1YSL8_9NOCA|nr:tetratricopeptide repeat protein [Nocardia vinacea]
MAAAVPRSPEAHPVANVVQQGDVAAVASEIPAQPELFADTLSLLVADAVWAAQRDGGTDLADDLVTALDRWFGHPLVSRAAALVTHSASFPAGELEPLLLALIRSARSAWRADRLGAPPVEVLRRRAESEHEDDRSMVAAELLAVAIESCEWRLAEDRVAALSLLADLLGELVSVLSGAEWGTVREQSELMARGAAAARRRLGILGQLSRTDRLRYRRPLAAAHWAAVDFVTWTDGPAAGIDHSRRGLLLYEEVTDAVGSAMLRRLDRATSRHIELLEHAGQVGQARRWRGRRTERLRGLAAAADTLAHRDLGNLIRQLSANDLRTEAAEVSARAVVLAEAEAAEADVAAVQRLARAMVRHGECLYRNGQRAEALLAWHRFLDVQRRLADLSADATAPAGCKEIITLVQRLGDLEAAVEFGDAAVDEWSRLSADNDQHLPTLIDELRAQAHRLEKAGRVADASEMAERAVTLARDLIAMDPQAHRPRLSWTLTCAAGMHLNSWRTADADSRSAEALELIEQLAREEPDRYVRALANALHNRAIARNGNKDYPFARELLARATAQYEVLAADNIAARASLANVLCTRAITLARLRELDEALDCAMRAEAIYTVLAETKPETYLPDLAYALNKVASIREDLGDDDGVRAAATRVLDICAELKDGPGRDAERASALHVMVENLTRTKRPGEALNYSTPLLEVRERMARRDPAASEVELAIALGNHSICLSQSVQPRPALDFAGRALELWRRLARTGQHRERLAGALDRYASDLLALRHREQAIAVSIEAVELYEQVLADHGQLYLATVANFLNNHAMRLAEVGRDEEAVATGLRGLGMFEDLMAIEPRATSPAYGNCLINHAGQLNDLERGAEALDYAARAIDLYEELSRADAGTHAVDLARALINYARAVSSLDRHEEAVTVHERALRLIESVAAHDRRRMLPSLAKAANGFTNRLIDAGQWERACAQARAAAQLWEELAAVDSELYLPTMADVLGEYARSFAEAEERAEAVGYAARATTAFEELTGRDALRYRPKWARAVEYHAYVLARAGDIDRGCAEADRAITIRQAAAVEAPEQNLPRLAWSHGWAARFLVDNERADLGPAHMERSAALYGQLMNGGRADLLPEWITTSRFYAKDLCWNGYFTQAAAAIEEAVRSALRLVAVDRERHRALLADVLGDRIWLLAEVGNRRAALATGMALLAVVQELVGASADDHRALLADSYDRVADCLADVGRIGEALAHNERALVVWEVLAQENGAPSWDLGWSLWRRARWLAEENADPTCLHLSQRAVEVMERTCGKGPGVSHHLAGTLVDHARHLARDGQHAQALACSSRALTMSETLADQKPRRYGPDLADCLRWHATHLAKSGDHEAAVECAERALRLASDAAEHTPASYLPDVAAISGELAGLLSDCDAVRAVDLARRAITLYAELAIIEPEAFGRPLRRLEEELGQVARTDPTTHQQIWMNR